MKRLKIPFDFISKVKKIRKDQLLIVFLVGVLLLVISLPVDENGQDTNESGLGILQQKEGGSEDTKDDDGKDTSQEEYQSRLEEKLKAVLSAMDGVGKVEVMVTLKDAGESIVGKDVDKTEQNTLEEDGSGTKRDSSELSLQQETIYERNEDQAETPFVSKEINPKVEGVLIVAQGGGNSAVIKNISQAVLALFPIEPHKIMVVKMNQ